MNHRLCPEYLSNLIPLHPKNRYDLRNNESVHFNHARRKSYRCSFLPTGIREWNALTPDLQQSPTMSGTKPSRPNYSTFVREVVKSFTQGCDLNAIP
ncbi:hypothetical protein DPMN_050000 [Dreissena polymorpha]|uniref:Uncharacterized protein n=1 Tax=Dreissena polymorpha TaxID=45954 RepID=A0A9D4CFB1_DREPO|nr:hypothetical protein DPMN_050000 [Dreissena polymorpha]